MVSIDGSVGEGGTNAKHDVAIVQLMLHLIKNAKGAPYYGAAYSGKYDTGTKDALAAFQKDQKIPIIPAKGVAKAGDEKSALASPAGSTFAKLSAALPAGYVDMRAIPNTTTVYLPAVSTDATASSAEVLAKADLDPAFRAKIADVITAMQQRYKVALAVVGPGWRRDFATQAAQTATGAGPGESNHNFGRAVDLGFKNFRLIDGSGKIVKEGGWLGSPTLGGVKSEQLWVARDVVAVKERGLFLTNFGGERVHLQNFSDASVNNRAALAKLLTTVGAMKWSHKIQYETDLGLGAKSVDAGTAKQIWSGSAPITKASIATAAAATDLATLAKNPLFGKFEVVQKLAKTTAAAKTGPAPAAAKAKLDAKDITAADVKLVQTALKGEFEKADANWKKWVPTK